MQAGKFSQEALRWITVQTESCPASKFKKGPIEYPVPYYSRIKYGKIILAAIN